METYAATRDTMKKRLDDVKTRDLAPFILLIDVWEDKVTGRKYLGEWGERRAGPGGVGERATQTVN